MKNGVEELNARFGLEGALQFVQSGELVRAEVHTPAVEATVYLQGAHLTHWQPAGSTPVLYLSGTSAFVLGKAIRGGVPVCWPWFGPRWDGGPGPAHGFARTAAWQVGNAALVGEDVHLSLLLEPSDESRALGYGDFQLVMEFVLGRRLRMRLSAANTGAAPLVFEEALHAYFRVGDVRQTELEGLESALYLDKTDSMREKETPSTRLVLTGETDRVFPENVASVTLLDPGQGGPETQSGARRITLDKSNSATTVVWNPWEAKAAALADLAPGTWTEFVCVETANTGSDRITLPPGEVHTLQAEVYVESGSEAA